MSLAPSTSVEWTLRAAAARLGVDERRLMEIVRGWQLEPTYSIAEVSTHLGCTPWQVNRLIQLGLTHGQQLHPTRGGLFPTFKTSRKSRRIPLSALERHKRHMARIYDRAA